MEILAVVQRVLKNDPGSRKQACTIQSVRVSTYSTFERKKLTRDLISLNRCLYTENKS